MVRVANNTQLFKPKPRIGKTMWGERQGRDRVLIDVIWLQKVNVTGQQDTTEGHKYPHQEEGVNAGTWMSWVRAPPHGLLLVLPLVSDLGSKVDPCRQGQTVLHELGEKMKMHGEIQLETEFNV